MSRADRPPPDERLDEERVVPDPADGNWLQHMQRYRLAADLVREADARSVLDVGCGEGYGCEVLAEVAERVVGVDYSETAVNHARERYGSDAVTFVRGDVRRLEELVEAGSFDAAVSFEVFEHLYVEDCDAYLRGVVRALRPGGLAVFSTPNARVESLHLAGAHQEYHHHVHSVDHAGLRAWLTRWFRGVEILGQRRRGRGLYGLLKRLDVFNLRHRLTSPAQREAALDGLGVGAPRAESDYVIAPGQLRQSGNLVAICRDPRTEGPAGSPPTGTAWER